MIQHMLLGDEAVARGALDAGISGAFGYPGTPATEILESVESCARGNGRAVVARWSANEKVALEGGLGMSFAGRRALVTMKHVGLNVAADPFMNAVVTGVVGGLVIAVADDPGMHSSQNEQDSRIFAEFAGVLCLEPTSAQEAYDLTGLAFDLSERLRLPVVVRLVTRLAHARAPVRVRPESARRPQNAIRFPEDRRDWTLLPINARQRWSSVVAARPALEQASAEVETTALALAEGRRLGVVATGIAYNYVMEALGEPPPPDVSVLKVTSYPVSKEKLARLVAHVDELLVVEEGQPYLEDRLRGPLDRPPRPMAGKRSGALPPTGEVNPDLVRRALGREPLPHAEPVPWIASRPPKLCPGCPHTDTFAALTAALDEAGFGRRDARIVFSDIGCYTLGAYPPFEAIDSCVCMGASVSMAVGAAAAGVKPVLCVIGDSTFGHSGMPGLLDAARYRLTLTVVIVDNGTVAMTGCQETATSGDRLDRAVLGLGIEPEHYRVIRPVPSEHEKNVRVIREEMAYDGPSVIVARRVCVQAKADPNKV